MSDFINEKLKYYAGKAMSEKEFFEAEIKKWKASDKRKSQITGDKYYNGEHDILAKKRTTIGKDGETEEVENLPNNIIKDNQYQKMVDQKTNYLVGKPFTIKSDNEEYAKQLEEVFDSEFYLELKHILEDALNQGVCYLYFYIENTKPRYKIIPAREILPFWKDRAHKQLDCAVRVYEVEAYDGQKSITIEKVEIYKVDGIEYYQLEKGILKAEGDKQAYFSIKTGDKTKEYNWDYIPLIAFKANRKEIPLICKVKSLQDAINTITSNFMDNMCEDVRNTIMVVVNYDGQDLGEFRRNLATFGAVKVRNIDGEAGGDVKTLTVEVNSENYKAILDILKKALIENARGFDARDERMGGTPNQMNIQSMYSDIDLDANGMEAEIKYSLTKLLWFINTFTGLVSSKAHEDKVEFVFNRDVMINTSTLITDIRNSVGLISNKTLVSKHPFVEDLDLELNEIKSEAGEEEPNTPFNKNQEK